MRREFLPVKHRLGKELQRLACRQLPHNRSALEKIYLIFMKIKKHILSKAYGSIDEYWSPVLVSELNGQAVKIAKVKGDFVMHAHQEEDEFFYVMKGHLYIELQDQTLSLAEGECVTIPGGVQHRPFAETETWIMLFEPQSTINTGAIENELTKKDLKKL